MSQILTPPFSLTPEMEQWVEQLVDNKVENRLKELQQQITDVQGQLEEVQSQMPADRVTIVLTGSEIDRVMPAFIIATGAASFGMECTIFFTLWGINVLKDKTTFSGKSFIEKVMTMMMPSNAAKLGLTKMHYMGAGAAMMRGMMAKHNIESIPSLINIAMELEVRMVACQMTMGMMGIKESEIRDGVEFGGVATYIEDSSDSKVTLFI